jgi:hypothetical protein
LKTGIFICPASARHHQLVFFFGSYEVSFTCPDNPRKVRYRHPYISTTVHGGVFLSTGRIKFKGGKNSFSSPITCSTDHCYFLVKSKITKEITLACSPSIAGSEARNTQYCPFCCLKYNSSCSGLKTYCSRIERFAPGVSFL